MVRAEEANKVLGGIDGAKGSDDTSMQFQNMWRGGQVLHLAAMMTRSPATLLPGIVDSCKNAFVVRLMAPKDRDLMMVHVALSKEGFVDEHYKRYISRMAVARSVVKLGYSRDKRDVQPMLAEALMVPAREPTDAGIHRHFLSQAR